MMEVPGRDHVPMYGAATIRYTLHTGEPDHAAAWVLDWLRLIVELRGNLHDVGRMMELYEPALTKRKQKIAGLVGRLRGRGGGEWKAGVTSGWILRTAKWMQVPSSLPEFVQDARERCAS